MGCDRAVLVAASNCARPAWAVDRRRVHLEPLRRESMMLRRGRRGTRHRRSLLGSQRDCPPRGLTSLAYPWMTRICTPCRPSCRSRGSRARGDGLPGRSGRRRREASSRIVRGRRGGRSARRPPIRRSARPAGGRAACVRRGWRADRTPRGRGPGSRLPWHRSRLAARPGPWSGSDPSIRARRPGRPGAWPGRACGSAPGCGPGRGCSRCSATPDGRQSTSFQLAVRAQIGSDVRFAADIRMSAERSIT